ncbi:ISL3 family transposase [Streptomyces sp. 6N106]|uniref:ISL3 family transposase n=1 Tax=Streptomyces sp. 6N106 TaxID=3457418 RepID=UPI003FD203C6
MHHAVTHHSEAIALALGGRAGARLAEFQAIGIGKDAMLRLIRALPDPEVGNVRALGVDDFALKRGHHYGTVLIDMEQRRPVDLLPERSADALADWLTQHPGVEVICRDRARYYAEGADRGAGAATQVADRFHLWKNLGEVAEGLVKRLKAQWAPPPSEPPEVTTKRPEGLRAQRARERHAIVHALVAKGLRHSDIIVELGLDPKTVRRFMRAASPEELIAGRPSGRTSVLDEHAAYPAARYAEGCRNSDLLRRELTARGLVVSERTVRRFLQQMRENNKPTTRPPAPKPREVTVVLLTHPDNREEADRTMLKELRDRSHDLDSACTLISRFAEILVHLRGRERLEQWVQDADASALPELRGFASGLRKDWEAVVAGLNMHWNSGPVEGHVNRIILWNQNCQACCALPWRTSRIGRRVAPAGTSSCRGVGPAGVGVSASLSRRRSSALWPSVTAACSSSVSGIETAIFCKLPLTSRSWALVESLGV